MKLPSLVGWIVILGFGLVGVSKVFVTYQKQPPYVIEGSSAIARVTLYQPSYRDLYISRQGLKIKITEVE